jgi:hypothetical protein
MGLLYLNLTYIYLLKFTLKKYINEVGRTMGIGDWGFGDWAQSPIIYIKN